MIIETIIAFLIVLYIYKSTSKPAGLPPGSFGLPIYGSIPPRGVHLAEHLTNLKKKYGNIFTTKWGSRVVIALADIESVKKGMNHPGLQGRGFLKSLNIFGYDLNLGLTTSEGKVWSDSRRFIIRYLHELGMAKNSIEVAINEEAEMLVKYMEETALDKPSEMDWGIDVAVLNVTWQLLAGKRYNADDQEIIQFNKLAYEELKIVQGLLGVFTFMPWLSKLFPKVLYNFITKKDVMERHTNYFFDFCKEIIMDHEANIDLENPKDIIDYYLIHLKENQNDAEPSFKQDHMNMVSTMGDLFTAGSETTSSTLRWMILYMAMRPDIQNKVQTEIDAVVPRDRLPSLEDRPMLPYLEAVLLDLMRLATLATTAIFHFATETVSLMGYVIPKDAIVLPCLELCHSDPAVWERPDELYPEHFLDENGQLDSKKESFIPFGLGRRKCLGESLARKLYYLLGSAILQRFTIEPPPGKQLVAESCPNEQFINTPKPFKVVLKKRK